MAKREEKIQEIMDVMNKSRDEAIAIYENQADVIELDRDDTETE